MPVFDLKNCSVKFKDDGSEELTAKVYEGNFSFTEKRNVVYIKDRGLLSTVRLGDQEPLEVKIDLIWEFISASTGSGTPTPIEAIKGIGEASGWASTSDDPCEPYCCDIELINTPPCEGFDIETIILPMFRWEQIDQNTKEGQLSVTGKCNVVAVTATRS